MSPLSSQAATGMEACLKLFVHGDGGAARGTLLESKHTTDGAGAAAAALQLLLGLFLFVKSSSVCADGLSLSFSSACAE